jgi:hypothetical protein
MKLEDDITDLTVEPDIDTQSEDQFNIIPIYDSRFESNNSKSRDSNEGYSGSSLKIMGSHSLNSNFNTFDMQNEPTLPSHKTDMSNDFAPNDVPPCGSSIKMLSSTSLLHGNCIFNRNNTVATQAGLKTYWLCKSYRISMCKGEKVLK